MKRMVTAYGKRLKLARKLAGLTQVELSKATGIPQSTISSAEVGGAGSAETPAIAAACAVDALWLAEGQGEPRPKSVKPAPLTQMAMDIAMAFDEELKTPRERSRAYVAIMTIINDAVGGIGARPSA